MPFFTADVAAAVTGRPNAFISQTAMLAANGGSLATDMQPTHAEFQAAVAAAGIVNTLAFYNGTDAEDEANATHRLDVDSEGNGLLGSVPDTNSHDGVIQDTAIADNAAAILLRGATLEINANMLELKSSTGATLGAPIDLSLYIDDTNLARLTSGSLDPTGIATFTRDDNSTFTVDFTSLLSDLVFTGSDGVADGTAGDVPAPEATDNNRFLRGDGTWADVTIPTWMIANNNDDTGTIDNGTNLVHHQLRGTGPVAFDLHSTPFTDGDELVFSRLRTATTPATITLTGDDNGPIMFVGTIIEGVEATDSIDLQPGEAVHLQRLNVGEWRVLSRTPGGSGGVSPYKNVSPEQSNGAGNNIGPTTTEFTILVGGNYVFDYFGNVASGTGGITITRGGTDLFVSAPATGDTDGARLSTTRQSNFTPPITLVAGDEIEVSQWAGGGGLVTDYTVCARLAGAESQPSVVTNATGVFKLSEDRPEIPVVIDNTNAQLFETGHQLVEGDGQYFVIKFVDAAGAHDWAPLRVDVDRLFERLRAGQDILKSLTFFDNDFGQIRGDASGYTEADLAAGRLVIADSGREMAYCWSILYQDAQTNEGVQQITGVTSFATTGTFQPLGDPNELFVGADGDRIHLRYGDLNTDTYVFFDGAIDQERRGQATADIEMQITAGGQVEIRDTANSSTVVAAWYEFKDGVIRTVKPLVSSDCTINVRDTGVAFDVSSDPTGIGHYLNTRRPLEMVFAKEGESSQSITVNRFDSATGELTPATFEDISNTNDNGNGVLNLTSGINSNFNRRARTNESIFNVGDRFDFTVGNFTNEFSGTHIVFTDVDPINAESGDTGEYRMSFVNATNPQYTLRNPAGDVVASGPRGNFSVQKTYYGIRLTVNGLEAYKSPRTDVPQDVIPGFTGTAQKTFELTSDRRPVTTLTDSGTTTELVVMNFNGANTPFIAIEFVNDNSQTHGAYLRPNTPGSGRQTQIRFSLGDATLIATNASGANTAEATILRSEDLGDTIKHYIQLNEAAGFEHTELEIGPAATDPLLVNTPAQTGSLGVVGVELFETNPLDQETDQLIQITDTAIAAATLVQTSTTQWAVSTADPASGEINLVSCEFHQIGRMRYYNVLFRLNTDSTVSFTVQSGEILSAAITGGYVIGGTSFEMPGNQFRKSTGVNEIQINRDNDNNSVNELSGTFVVLMP